MSIQTLLLFPDHPLLSWVVLYILAATVLYVARIRVHALITSLLGGTSGAFWHGALWLYRHAGFAYKRYREILEEYHLQELESRLEREFQRIGTQVPSDLAQYPSLHRNAAQHVAEIKALRESADSSPNFQLPAAPWPWSEDDIRAVKGEGKMDRKALKAIGKKIEQRIAELAAGYKEEQDRRFSSLSKLDQPIQALSGKLVLLGNLNQDIQKATKKIDDQIDSYRQMRDRDDRRVRAAANSSLVRFAIAVVFLVVAAGGSVMNFQLIAKPMSELVGTGLHVAGFAIAQIAALAIIFLEGAAGITLMEALDITHLLPVITSVDHRRRRLLIVASLSFLVILGTIEAGLAFMREVLVATEQETLGLITGSGTEASKQLLGIFPVGVQALLGFIMPFILALAAIPLEMLFHTGRIFGQLLWSGLLNVTGYLLSLVAQLVRMGKRVLLGFYDLVIFLPLAVEGRVKALSVRAGK